MPLPNGLGSTGPLPKFAAASNVDAMIADDQALYFSDIQGSSGNVMRCADAGCGGQAEVIAPDEAAPLRMAQDSQSIFWVTYGTAGVGSVVRLAK